KCTRADAPAPPTARALASTTMILNMAVRLTSIIQTRIASCEALCLQPIQYPRFANTTKIRRSQLTSPTQLSQPGYPAPLRCGMQYPRSAPARSERRGCAGRESQHRSMLAAVPLQRERQQRVDAAAIAHDHPLAQPQRAALLHHRVEVAPSREQIHRPVAHDADDQEWRLRAGDLTLRADDCRQPDEVAVRLPLVDVGLAQRGHAIAQHAVAVGVDQ